LHRPDLARLDRPPRGRVARLEAKDVTGQDRHAALLGPVADEQRVVDRVRERLLDEQRLARLDRRQRRLDVEVLRRAHDDRIDLGIAGRLERIGDEPCARALGGLPTHVRSQVADDAKLGERVLGERARPARAHEAEPDHRDTGHAASSPIRTGTSSA
jgi:hypothetical protein